MDITCEQCNGKFKIPDEKLPKNRAFSITCPKCRNKIAIDARKPSPPGEPKDPIPSLPTETETAKEKTLFDEVAASNYDSSEKPFDFVEEGVETALLCEPDDNVRSKIHAVLVSLGYQTTEPSSSVEALKQMRFHVFDLIILNERYDTVDPGQSDVLKYLGHLSMDIRRNIFVALITDRFRTMDNMAAFNQSVNLTINSKNVDEFEKILARGVADNDTFYRVFKESLVSTGRV